jgi:hypothetical protein
MVERASCAGGAGSDVLSGGKKTGELWRDACDVEWALQARNITAVFVKYAPVTISSDLATRLRAAHQEYHEHAGHSIERVRALMEVLKLHDEVAVELIIKAERQYHA